MKPADVPLNNRASLFKQTEPPLNAGFCRGFVDNVIINIKSTSEYLKVLKRFVGEYKQPTIRFEATPSDDDNTSFDTVIYDWPAQSVSISFPVAPAKNVQGAIILSGGKVCR